MLHGDYWLKRCILFFWKWWIRHCISKFLFKSRLLKPVVLPNGKYPGPRKCTKLTKPPVAILRLQGWAVAIYKDAIITVDDVFESCLTATIKTINLFQSVSFIIHPTKSNFITSKKVENLGVITDSRKW